jgi:cytoskeletal protein CcmA (bactofilin family)
LNLTILSGTPVQLDSHFKGEIAGEGTILVAERGEVESDIVCKSIVVLGKVAGSSVNATEAVEVRKRAVVLGALSTPVLMVERGGYFDGQCHMPTERHEKNAEEGCAEHPAASNEPETSAIQQ